MIMMLNVCIAQFNGEFLNFLSGMMHGSVRRIQC